MVYEQYHHPINNDGIRCCCGQAECAFLRENQLALEAVEKDLDTAARLGQALLHRHESYIAEAEEDRRRLLDSIDTLERERRQVLAENARIIQENRSLVEQLDALNNTVADSDAHVNSLTIALENTEAELRTVSATAARAAELEAQLSRMETEQSKLQESLLSAREDEKSASQRWKKADSTLRELHEQVERLETEAREERERHAELVQRMERQRTVERELDGAAERLKGAAAAHHMGRQPHQTNVVSRFVRDILQDNANLQIGIMELRDMLESSNQEVQNLRDQILSHQPLNHDEEDGEDIRPSSEARPTAGKRLSQELDGTPTPRVSPEYHIHHHYHPPSVTTQKKEKPKPGRRFSKKRRSIGLMHSARQPSVSSTSTILSQTSVSIPPSHRWSAQSSATESLASSPHSGGHYRSASIFDRIERGFESSRPTSPESTALSSPLFGVARQGKTLDPPFREDSFGRAIEDELANLDALNDYCSTVPAIPEEGEDAAYMQENGNQRPATPDDYRPRRRGSHDSLLSVAGMDIHTPSRRARGPQPSIPIARLPRRNFSSGGNLYSTPPVISTTTVTADRETPSKNPQQSPRSLLASVCRSQGQGQETDNTPAADSTPSRKPSLSRRVGGWVRGRWGTAPVAASRPTESESQAQPSTPSPAVNALTKSQNKAKGEYVPAFRFRHPGVNQKGPIMGFRPSSHPPISVHAEVVDEGALRESLAE